MYAYVYQTYVAMQTLRGPTKHMLQAFGWWLLAVGRLDLTCPIYAKLCLHMSCMWFAMLCALSLLWDLASVLLFAVMHVDSNAMEFVVVGAPMLLSRANLLSVR